MPTTKRLRYETLDAWRGAACLLVVVFHCVGGYVGTPEFEARLRTQGGSAADWLIIFANRFWVGVPVFFVISGFCIAAAADSAREKPNAGRRFLTRRFRRIYPPLWAYLAITAFVVAFLPTSAIPGPVKGLHAPLPRPQAVLATQWLGSLTLTESWRYNLGGPPLGYFTGQLWTLCYEEQFYAVVALAVALARRWLFAALGAVTAAVFLNVGDPATMLPADPAALVTRLQCPLRGFFFDGLWLPFAAGVAVYYRARHATPILKYAVDGFLLCGALWSAHQIPESLAFIPNVPGYLLVACLVALALGHLYRFDRVTSTTRVLAPLRFCGRMCYSLYLVHSPVASLLSWCLFRAGVQSSVGTLLVTVPVIVVCSVALSYPFYALIERRFHNSPAPKPAGPTPCETPAIEVALERELARV